MPYVKNFVCFVGARFKNLIDRKLVFTAKNAEVCAKGAEEFKNFLPSGLRENLRSLRG